MFTNFQKATQPANASDLQEFPTIENTEFSYDAGETGFSFCCDARFDPEFPFCPACGENQ
jgi:hypothetical protein